jgi:hypothetical protein
VVRNFDECVAMILPDTEESELADAIGRHVRAHGIAPGEATGGVPHLAGWPWSQCLTDGCAGCCWPGGSVARL